MNGKIFAIGDIHGCAAKLSLLLQRLPFEPARDTLVFLGDYLDRGPQAKEVLEQICCLRRKRGERSSAAKAWPD